MLEINKLVTIPAYNAEWKKQRLGKITSSNFGKLVGEKSDKGVFTDGAHSYIDGIIGELLTGDPARSEFNSSATDYGNAEEPFAINYFSEFTGKQILRDTETDDTHRLVHYDQYTSCTPDALVALAPLDRIFDETKTKLKVAPLEVKAPPVHQNFMKIYKCDTPLQLKEANKLYFWQALTQLIFVDSLVGYFMSYNEKFPNRGKVITFKKAELLKEVTFAKATLHHAQEEIKKGLQYFKQTPTWKEAV